MTSMQACNQNKPFWHELSAHCSPEMSFSSSLVSVYVYMETSSALLPPCLLLANKVTACHKGGDASHWLWADVHSKDNLTPERETQSQQTCTWTLFGVRIDINDPSQLEWNSAFITIICVHVNTASVWQLAAKWMAWRRVAATLLQRQQSAFKSSDRWSWVTIPRQNFVEIRTKQHSHF